MNTKSRKQHSKKAEVFSPFHGIAEKMRSLTAQAIGEYVPLVEAVINEKSFDIKRIERIRSTVARK